MSVENLFRENHFLLLPGRFCVLYTSDLFTEIVSAVNSDAFFEDRDCIFVLNCITHWLCGNLNYICELFCRPDEFIRSSVADQLCYFIEELYADNT